MKRQKMQLMTILGLFLVLVLATFWMKQLQKKEESAGQKSVLSLDKGKVVSFTLSRRDLRFEKIRKNLGVGEKERQ